jgi:hypothetical protein
MRAGAPRRVWRCALASPVLAIPPVESPGVTVRAIMAVSIAHRPIGWWDPGILGRWDGGRVDLRFW